jgi:hypothetical protein
MVLSYSYLVGVSSFRMYAKVFWDLLVVHQVNLSADASGITT